MDSRRYLLQNMQNPPQVSTPVLGAVYLKDCPQQQYIPIYLLVLGTFALLLGVLSCLPCTREPVDRGNGTLSTICNVWNSMVSVFLFCWFIAGNVWIYSIYPANYNQTLPNMLYCNKTLYLFSFWTTTMVYMLFALCCCVLICMCVYKEARPHMQYSRDA